MIIPAITKTIIAIQQVAINIIILRAIAIRPRTLSIMSIKGNSSGWSL